MKNEEDKESRVMDKVLAIIARAIATRFTTDSCGIAMAFHEMKEKFPGEFEQLRFTFDGTFYESDDLDQVFSCLSMFSVICPMGPDYRYYHVPAKTIERGEQEIIPSLSPSFIEALPEMVKIFSRLSKQC